MEWISCNKCTLKFESDTLKFFLLTCGNILCEKCLTKTRNGGKCCVCDKAASFVELNKNLDFKMQMYFWSTENLFTQLEQIIAFQNMQKKLFLKMLNGKYTFAKQQCLKLDSACKKLEKENKELQNTIKSMAMKRSTFKTSTPSSTGFYNDSSTKSFNNSAVSSIRFTSAMHVPGSAQRISNSDRSKATTFQLDSFNTNPSPIQMVPGPYPVPVHRPPSVLRPPNMIAPRFMEKSQRKPTYSFGGCNYPRK